MSIWKADKKSNKIPLEVLTWAGLQNEIFVQCPESRVNNQIIVWILGDYGEDRDNNPFYDFTFLRSYFHRDSIVRLS